MSYRVLEGDVMEVLKTLPDESVQCCITSPPYFGLRDYQIPPSVWPKPSSQLSKISCQHEWITEEVEREMRRGLGLKDSPASTRGGAIKCAEVETQRFERGFCRHCGAWKGCLGLEPTPELYVAHMVEVFREARRVLRSDGTLWLNLGDCYANDGKWGGETGGKQAYLDDDNRKRVGREKRLTGLKPKDLVGIPWMLAFALRADGWWLRSEIIWFKPNPFPESVTDRPTKAHEQLFLLTKSARYFYDAEAIKEPGVMKPQARLTPRDFVNGKDAGRRADRRPNYRLREAAEQENAMRNKRDVWTIADESPQRYGPIVGDPDDTPPAQGKWSGENPQAASRRMTDNVRAARAAGGAHDNPFSPHGRGPVVGDPDFSTGSKHGRGMTPRHTPYTTSCDQSGLDSVERGAGRNKRSVWEIATQPWPQAHFATFPEKLVEPCILAGTSERGCCPQCGAPWRRPTFRACKECGEPIPTQADECGNCGHVNDWKKGRVVSAEMLATDFHTPGRSVPRYPGGFENKTQSGDWQPTCSCGAEVPVPCTVLDCFCGSGSCGVVALRYGRDFIGIELNPQYAEMARRRIEGDAPLFNTPSGGESDAA